jgi:uncharacterized alpha-E superfamily protein
VLARNAESLYWIGRYVERADDTARILNVSVHHLLEDATVDPDTASRQLLAVLGIPSSGHGELDLWKLTELVAYSKDNATSIVGSINAARENTRGAREVVPTELWECLNTTWNAVPDRQRYARRAGPHAFLSFIEERAAMFAGLSDSTMSRDDGWLFMVLGRSLERADMVIRLLLSRVQDKVSSPGWMTVLSSAGAQDTYLRTYRGVLDAKRVVQFLLRDNLFPRSVFHALQRAEHSLDQLDPAPMSRRNEKSEALRLIGRARSELEFLRPADLLEDLPKRLGALQNTIRDVGEAVSVQYFHTSPWVAWRGAEVSL